MIPVVVRKGRHVSKPFDMPPTRHLVAQHRLDMIEPQPVRYAIEGAPESAL